ncbi:MAG: iron-sulfur cluster assembly scaffold protein [Maricaulaceae bacterium]
MLGSLYNTDVLTLSSQLENTSLDAPDGTSRKVSKLCGSWLEVDINVDGDVVSEVALRVQACALGQASAAILQAGIIGAGLPEIETARDALRAMLKEGGDAPRGRFEKLSLLAGVAEYPARHTSTMLAFDAAVEAVTKALAV